MSEVPKPGDVGGEASGGAFMGGEGKPDKPFVPQSIHSLPDAPVVPTWGAGSQLGSRDDASDLDETGDYIGKGMGGVPKKIFDSGEFRKESLPSKSGRNLRFLMGPNFIGIRTPDETTRFTAEVDESGTLTLNINNKDLDGNRDPDLFPAALVRQSISYFERNGRAVRAIEAQWRKPGGWRRSDNLSEYNANLAGSDPSELTDTDLQDAAKNTWTGRLAQSLGFTEVRGTPVWSRNRGKGKSEKGDRTLITRFVRPEQPK